MIASARSPRPGRWRLPATGRAVEGPLLQLLRPDVALLYVRTLKPDLTHIWVNAYVHACTTNRPTGRLTDQTYLNPPPHPHNPNAGVISCFLPCFALAMLAKRVGYADYNKVFWLLMVR